MSHQKKYGFPLLKVISNAGHGVGGGCMEHYSRSLNFTCSPPNQSADDETLQIGLPHQLQEEIK